MISWKRFKEFLRVAFGPRVTWRNYLAILKAGLSIARSRTTQEEWRSRIQICYKCPIFNKDLKTCRPFPKSIMGCGCYVPYKALVNRGHCWGRKKMGDNFGW